MLKCPGCFIKGSFCTDNNDIQIWRNLFNQLQYLMSIHLRHFQIEQHDIEIVSLQYLQGMATADGCHTLITVEFQ